MRITTTIALLVLTIVAAPIASYANPQACEPGDYVNPNAAGGTATSDLDMSGYDIAGFDDLYGDQKTTDTSTGLNQIHGADAFANATGGNQAGAQLDLAGGIGSHTFTVADYSQCATDTMTITVDGSAYTCVEGTHFDALTSNAVTCNDLASCVQSVPGISAGSVCSSNVLLVIPEQVTSTLTIATGDATCATVVNGTAGSIKSWSTLDMNGNAIDNVTSLTSAVADPGDGATGINLGNAECVQWELATPGTDKTLCVDSSDQLAFNGIIAPTTGVLSPYLSTSGDVGDSGVIRATSAATVLACENTTPGTDSTWACTSNVWTSNVPVAAPSYVTTAADPSDAATGLRCGNNETCMSAELATPGTDATFKLNASNAWESPQRVLFGSESAGSVAHQYIVSGNDGGAYAPTTFSSHHFVVGRTALTGATSGGLFMGYHSTDNYAVLGALSPLTAWRPTIYNLQGPTNTAPFILGPAVELEWAAGAGSPTTQDVGLRRNAAGVLQVTNGGTGYGGLLGSYFSTSTAEPSDTGIYRCANNESCLTAELSTPGTDLYIKGHTSGYWETSGLAATATSSVTGDFYVTGMYILNGAGAGFRSDNAATGGSTGTVPIRGAYIYNTANKGQATVETIRTQTLTCSGGGSATLTTSGAILDGDQLIGVTVRVTTALTGPTSWDAGDGSDVDLYAATKAVALSTTSNNSDATANWSNPQLANGEVTITMNGGNCTAGALSVNAHVKYVIAPTSN